MAPTAALLACLILAVLSVFQLSLALGAPLGRFAWGGQHRTLPLALRVGSGVSILVYALIAVVVLARADLVWARAPDGVLRTASWVVAAYFFIGIALNAASRSKGERAVMTPAAAALCILCVAVASSS
ncbi:hypothetical protein DDE18_02615 [Nocardioides gansuensis]|uniref:Integral membrane protein n=1 Tax=Nocardioides gansuensis TaxID=2138300 RepID=A0A2T8FFP6_9ACTN|nr:hypothetical protein [Nocardioides gansuensis]PVG84515.1 hypothetical protein DDE18_02615 [Nocardioides gansuensis]